MQRQRQKVRKHLLEKCLKGATQNTNEAFNGTLWHMCPKEGSWGREVVELAASLATIAFNDGALGLQKVIIEMGCVPGHFTATALSQEDSRRVRKADLAMSAGEKRRRKQRGRRRNGWAGRCNIRVRSFLSYVVVATTLDTCMCK